MKLTIFDIDNWKEIGSTLARNKTRTFLTGFGIFWGVAMLALLMGGARATQAALSSNFKGFATNSGGMFANTTTMPYKGLAKGRTWRMDLTDVERIRQTVPELKAVVPVFQSWGTASCRNGRYSYAGSALGAVPEYVEINAPLILSGRFINEADEAMARKVVVLGKKIVNEIFPGTPDPVGRSVLVNGVTYSVIGVAVDQGEVNLNGRIDETVVMPSATFRKAFARADKVDLITFVARDGVKIRDLMPRIRSTLYRRHNINPADESALWMMDISEMFENVDSLFAGVNFLALFIGASTLLAGIIGIGNIMWVIVKERTQEIGIRRAIGAKPRDIVAQVLSEGAVLTLVAGVAGICFSAAVLGIANYAISKGSTGTTSLQMSFGSSMAILATFMVLGILAGLVPSLKAMKIKPIEALNDK